MPTPEIFSAFLGDSQFTKGTGVLCSGLLAYKNFLISGGGLPNWPASMKWRALGLVVPIAAGGRTVVLRRLEDDQAFQSPEESEVQALEVAKQWIDRKMGRMIRTESLARPEGFEPPTLRSEVRPKADSQKSG